MNLLCPACRTPLPKVPLAPVVGCTECGVEVDVSRVDTAPGGTPLKPDLDLAGGQLGPYLLRTRLGAGGMGVVYEAQGPEGGCAVKVLGALLAADPGLRLRFRREAQALSQVRHPGVVRVLGEGESQGICWYAMERVSGSDLRARIQKGALPAAEVESLARLLLEALEAVHAAGLVHRDVKPGNILLDEEGAPKLCDFGIVRIEGATTMTESAAILGSLRYMAPEQRLGKASARSDLYALGITLHEALTGGVPDEVPLPRSTPRRLRRLVEALTRQRAAERPHSAREALQLLDARAITPVRAIAVGLGIMLIASAAWALRPRPAPIEKPAEIAVQKDAPAPKEPPPPVQTALPPTKSAAALRGDELVLTPGQAPADTKTLDLRPTTAGTAKPVEKPARKLESKLIEPKKTRALRSLKTAPGGRLPLDEDDPGALPMK